VRQYCKHKERRFTTFTVLIATPYPFPSSDRRWLSSEWSNNSADTLVHPVPAGIKTGAEFNNNNNNNNNNNLEAPKVEAIVLREELIQICQLKTVFVIPLVLSTTIIIPNKLHESLKLLNLALLCIL
jgi:hypothetical protein